MSKAAAGLLGPVTAGQGKVWTILPRWNLVRDRRFAFCMKPSPEVLSPRTPGHLGFFLLSFRVIRVPRYYFDVDDGQTFTQDQEGVELEDIEAARVEIQRAVLELAKDRLPVGSQRGYIVAVRDESGQVVLRITLKLKVESFPAGPTA